MTTITFAVTAFEEMREGGKYGQNILNCIRAACEYDAINEIVVVDDGSSDWTSLARHLLETKCPKLRAFPNRINRGVFGNKIEAIARSNGDWVITCDSDNVMDEGFIDDILFAEKDPDTWLCPSFARANFDYRGLVGHYDLANIGEMLDRPAAPCCMNTGNQTVHRETFMEVFGKYRGKRADLMMPNWLKTPEPDRSNKYWRLVFDACDSFLLNMQWLYAGKALTIVEGLEYEHFYSAGPDSNYARAPDEKSALAQILLKELKARSQDAAR